MAGYVEQLLESCLQAALAVVAYLADEGAVDRDLASVLFPLLTTGELRNAHPPVKACAALALGHFGASCARLGSRSVFLSRC